MTREEALAAYHEWLDDPENIHKDGSWIWEAAVAWTANYLLKKCVPIAKNYELEDCHGHDSKECVEQIEFVLDGLGVAPDA